MALSIGTQAPDFALSSKNAEGLRTITLSDHFGKNPTVLLFFPMVFTSVCTEEMCAVSAGLGDYSSLNATVYGISGDNPFAQEVWATKESITVPLLSDYDHRVAQAYDVAYESFLPQVGLTMGGVPARSAFVIDKEGIIRYAEENRDPKVLPNFEAIKACLAELS